MNKEDVEERPQNAFFRVPVQHAHKYYFVGRIKSPEEYTQWFEQIRNTPPEDAIVFHINSEGGNAFTTLQFLRALGETQATKIASVEGLCLSAATMMFLAMDSHYISEHSMFLIHDYSGMQIGKGGEMFDSISHSRTWSSGLLRDIYRGFLTEPEIDSVLDNKDIWMGTEEVQKRLRARAELFKSENEAKNLQQQKEIQKMLKLSKAVKEKPEKKQRNNKRVDIGGINA